MPSVPQVLILLFCGWRCYDLVIFWQTAPNAEYYGWVILALWLLPLIFTWTLCREQDQKTYPLLSLLGLAFSTGGMLGSFNILEHIGFTLACAAFIPWSSFTLLWIITAISWMPAFTWFSGYVKLEYSFLGRCLLVTLVLLAYRFNRQKQWVTD